MASQILFPPRDESAAFLLFLNDYYRDVMRRPVTAPQMALPGREPVDFHVDLEGLLVWLPEYLRCRVNGYSHADACADVQASIQDIVDPAGAPHPRPAAPAPPSPPSQPTTPLPPSGEPLAHPEVFFANCLRQADGARPDLRITNTHKSCGELLTLALKIAESQRPGEFAFIGKTSGDGGKFIPHDFVPQTVPLARPDGQTQQETVVGASMDAVWYLPARKQVKGIVNSSANDDPRPEIHGPAGLGSYLIPEFNDQGERNYRWHNPPVAVKTLKVVPGQW